MKEITHTEVYKEPLVLVLLDQQFGRMSTSRNLLPGQTITVGDNQISPECKVLEKKKIIKIVDVKSAEIPTESTEDLAALEKELLGYSCSCKYHLSNRSMDSVCQRDESMGTIRTRTIRT